MKERIGKYYNVITGYAFKSSDLKDSADIPIIKIGNISNGRNVIFENMQYVDLEFLTIGEKYHIKYGDVLISLTGSHINQPNSMVGRVCRNYDKQTYLLNQRAGKIFAKENASTDYIFYALLTKAMKESIVSRAYGAANQVNVSPSAIMSIKWDFPSLPIQQKIASILSAYDRLIENNTRRIRLLEQMAENLYKEWFVRFRFPGHENVEMVNGLPKGWERVVASSIIDVMSGGTPKTAHQEFYNGNIPFYTPKDANDSIFVYNTLTNITEEGLVHCNSQLYPRNTLIITARGTVGKLSLLAVPMAMNQSCFALQLKKEKNPFFLYYAIRTEVAKLKKMANGGVFDTIVVKSFDHIKLMVPSHSLMDNFNLKVCPILEKVRSLSYQNQLLIRQRDLLLPRLMSGKLEVKS